MDAISDESLPVALDLFAELDGLEATLYGQIVHQRIAIITTLRKKVDENALEKAIQEFLFDHLWLLDPSWERAEGTDVMETRATKLSAEADAGLTKEEKRGRLDIAYRKAAGGHVIVELKRPERVVDYAEMQKQSEKYLAGMEKLLTAQGTPNEPIDIVFVLGVPPREWTNERTKQRNIEQLATGRTRVVYCDKLLVDAEKSYRDYLEHRSTVDALGRIMQAIDDYAPAGD